MENEKVLLRIETPFSLQNKNTRTLVLIMGSLPIMMIAMLVMLYCKDTTQELAQRMTIFAAAWFVLGAIPSVRIIFFAYAMAEDGDLIVDQLGFFPKRYPRNTLQKAVQTVNKGYVRIEIYAEGKSVVSMPDNAAARSLVRKLRIPAEYEIVPL